MIGFVAYYYQYGFHTLWCIPTFVPGGLLVSYLILPVLYELRVTSIFEQTIGAAGLYSAAVALTTRAFPVQLMRLGLDQVITQRFMAARSLTQARKVALGGVSLLSLCYILHGLTGLAVVYWYRGCDPVLSGSITRYDQIVPYYINKSASSIDGFRGLFLAGLVSASISTVSSVVNSHAAVLYVDIVSPYIRISEKKSGLVMAALADDYKIVLRIRGGLRCADIPLPKLIQAVLKAAALTSSLHDQYRINSVSNILLISTPDSERTEAYHRIKTIKMDERSFEVVTHITDPSNTCRGVIRNIPMDHTAETILSSLLDYDRLGLILTGRRMGATTSILVTFRGTRVPFYISYQGGITRCVPYRHKTEACTLCRKLGHRPDVCPGAPQTLCPLCGIPNPLLDHECEPKCVVCDNDHPTGSPQCPQRYKPKPNATEQRSISRHSRSSLAHSEGRSRGTGLYLSLRRRSRLRSKHETFLGSRTIRTIPLALSMVASNVSASGLIAFTAHYYVYGFHTLWAIPVFVPAVLMVAYLFLPVLYELKVTSVFEVTYSRCLHTPLWLLTDLDLTTDETVWAASVAAFPYQLMRLGLDQMITQRFLAARSLRQARVVTFMGAGLLAFFYALGGFTALAIVLWFRDCDPYLSGSISRYDQIVPYYINKSASAVAGVRGLFLAGVVSASISTISSIVNSQAAVLYVDIVSPKVRVSEKTTPFVIAGLAVTSGTVVTLFGLAVPYAGSAARFCISLYSSASGPFAGIMILAFLFPWANARGTATAALAVFLVQTWQTTGRFLSRIEPNRMSYSVERCPFNSTTHERDSPSGSFEVSEVFLLYRLSPYWCCLLSACATVLLGLVFSLSIAGPDDSLKNAARLSTPAMLNFWQRVGLLQHFEKVTGQITAIDPCFKVSPFELQNLHESQDGHRVHVDATKESDALYMFAPLAS
ncbi:hypothetical protein MTO96_002304 [Rhipicephalus appendiculatus]